MLIFFLNIFERICTNLLYYARDRYDIYEIDIDLSNESKKIDSYFNMNKIVCLYIKKIDLFGIETQFTQKKCPISNK